MPRRRSASHTGLASLAAFAFALGMAWMGPGLPGLARAEEDSAAPAQAARVLTLAQAEQAALAQQPQLLVARAATNTALALADQARAPLLPQVTATAEYSRLGGSYAALSRSSTTTGTTTGLPSADRHSNT